MLESKRFGYFCVLPPKFHGTLSSFVLDPLSIFLFQHLFSQGFVANCSFEGLDCVVYILGSNLSLLQKDPKRLWHNLIRSLLLIPATGQRFAVQGGTSVPLGPSHIRNSFHFALRHWLFSASAW